MDMCLGLIEKVNVIMDAIAVCMRFRNGWQRNGNVLIVKQYPIRQSRGQLEGTRWVLMLTLVVLERTGDYRIREVNAR